MAGNFICMHFTCLACASSWVLPIIAKPHLLLLTHDETFRRRPTAHGQFSLLRYRACPNGTYGCVWNCAHWRVFERGYEKVAVCPISRATRLSLGDCLYKSNTKKYMGGGGRTGDRRCILTLCNKSSLLVTVQSCANILAIFLPNGVSPSNNKILHVSAGYFFPILTQFEISRQNCDKISQYKISQNLPIGKRVVSRGRGKLTGIHDEANTVKPA